MEQHQDGHRVSVHVCGLREHSQATGRLLKEKKNESKSNSVYALPLKKPLILSLNDDGCVDAEDDAGRADEEAADEEEGETEEANPVIDEKAEKRLCMLDSDMRSAGVRPWRRRMA